MSVPPEITQAIPETCPFGGQQLLNDAPSQHREECLTCHALNKVWWMYATALGDIADLKKQLQEATACDTGCSR